MEEFVLRASFGLAVLASAFGCTTNVEEPVVNQTGRTGDTACVKTCDDKKTSCTAKCTEDTCKASCETEHQTCITSCSPRDGG